MMKKKRYYVFYVAPGFFWVRDGKEKKCYRIDHQGETDFKKEEPYPHLHTDEDIMGVLGKFNPLVTMLYTWFEPYYIDSIEEAVKREVERSKKMKRKGCG